ncbi:hypothetical protein PENTCL1PPCAC_27917, partial [Pristionchus entomophagus]
TEVDEGWLLVEDPSSGRSTPIEPTQPIKFAELSRNSMNVPASVSAIHKAEILRAAKAENLRRRALENAVSYDDEEKADIKGEVRY